MSIRNYIKKNRRQNSIAYLTICSGATSLNTPQLAAGSFIVKSVEIEWEDLYMDAANIAEDWKYKIEYSNDSGITWNTLVDYSIETPYTAPETSMLQTMETDITCNSFRVTINDKPSQRPLAWASIPEFRTFAVDTSILEEEGQDMNIDMAYG